jgi:hypothetical protein
MDLQNRIGQIAVIENSSLPAQLSEAEESCDCKKSLLKPEQWYNLNK